MRTRGADLTLWLVVMTLTVALSGCPKRPVTSVASAPAPTPPIPAPAPAPPAAVPAPPAAAPVPPPPAPAPSVTAPPAPSPPSPAPPADYVANPAVKDIFFDFDKAIVRREDARTLDASASYLKANPTQLLLIEGHCDERGTNEYNLALGERRAKAAMTYLVAHGIEARRISIVSYGKERPMCTEKTPACWARNRRAHFLTKAS